MSGLIDSANITGVHITNISIRDMLTRELQRWRRYGEIRHSTIFGEIHGDIQGIRFRHIRNKNFRKNNWIKIIRQ